MLPLFPQLCQIETLKTAWLKVFHKKAAGGLDGVQPGDLEADIDRHLTRLAQELSEQTYTPAPYARGAMPKFNEAGEWRRLSLPTVRDKIVQQALVLLLEPVFDPEFLDVSYAYRQGKGAVKAIKRLEHICRSYSVRWVAVADIDNFFDTMDQELLLAQVRARVPEMEILRLVSLWLKAGLISPRGDWEETSAGIAQGAVLSPLLSNLYLHPLDRFAVSQEGCHYLRYSDNFILLSSDKDPLYAAYQKVRAFLKDELKLRLNDNPYPFKDVYRGFVFLGIYFRGNERHISQGKENKTLRKLDWLTEKRHQTDPEVCLRRLNDAIASARRYYAFINPSAQFEAYDQHLKARLQVLLRYFLEKGLLSGREELANWVKRLELYGSRPLPDQEKWRRTLVAAALADAPQQPGAQPIPEVSRPRAAAPPPPPAIPGEPPPAVLSGKPPQPVVLPAPEGAEEAAAAPAPLPAAAAPSPASQARMDTARKSRYLRQVADQAEIFVSRPGLSVGKTGTRLILREQRKNVMECHFRKIRHLSIASRGVSLSSDLIYACSEQQISITFYGHKGNPEAVLHSPMHPLGEVSVLQLKMYETPRALEFVKKLLTGKSKNQINLIKFYLRHRKEAHPEFSQRAEDNLQAMEKLLQDLAKLALEEVFAITRDRLFMNEARISAHYWDTMKMLAPPELEFVKRQRQNAPDVVNNMLNYGYGILYQRVWRAVLKAGLNPHISFLHALQPRKPTLVYDLVEEYRQAFVDRAVFSLLTRGQKGRDLQLDKNTGLLTTGTRSQVIKAVLGRLAGLISYRSKKIKAEDVIDHQVDNLVKFLVEKKNYRPFVAAY